MIVLFRRETDALVHWVAVVRRADMAMYQAVAGGIAVAAAATSGRVRGAGG